MKIISHEESRQILRNLYQKEARQKHADQLRVADAEERARIFLQIDREAEQRLRQQVITGH